MVMRSENHSVFFSGDTGLTGEYALIRERLGPFDLVMLEVGAFHPSWGDIHLGPENALKAHALLGGGAFLPVHWGTFSLAMHDWDEPAETLAETLVAIARPAADAAPGRGGGTGARTTRHAVVAPGRPPARGRTGERTTRPARQAALAAGLIGTAPPACCTRPPEGDGLGRR